MKLPQFSSQRLLAAITLIAVSVAMYCLARNILDSRDGETIGSILALSALLLFGAGVGTIFRHPFWGAVIAIALFAIYFVIGMLFFVDLN